MPRSPDDVVALSGTYIHSICLISGGRLLDIAVYCDNQEGSAVNVHRVNEAVVPTEKAYLQSFTNTHRNCVRRGIRSAVDREIVWLSTIHRQSRISESVA